MRSPTHAVATVAAALLAGSVGCGSDGSSRSDEPTQADSQLVDAQRGAVRTVGLGSSAKDVQREFGNAPRYSDTDAVAPLGENTADLGLPHVVAPPGRGESFDELQRGTLRYRGALFQTSHKAGVYALSVSSSNARTEEDLEIGEPLARVRKIYPQLQCDIRNQGTEATAYPYCTGKMRRGVYIWIGEDPIKSISFATKPMG